MTAGERRAEAQPSMRDTFEDARPRGRVSGSAAQQDTARLVTDAERRISIDRGALRFEPLMRSGWGRQGVAYGPYRRQGGLAFATYLLNGHNGSHSGGIDGGLRLRLIDWLQGPRGTGVASRLWGWLRYRRKRESLWLWRWWLRRMPRFSRGEVNHDNLAVGWFGSAAPLAPFEDGHALVSRTLSGETGQLLAAVRGRDALALPVLLNVPTYYVCVLREHGAAYYAASLPDIAGLPCYPRMRPLAIDRSAEPAEVYAGVHQSVLGQVGFSADTRVYGAAIEVVPELASWYGTAQAADPLSGEGALAGSAPELGPHTWQPLQGALERTPDGTRPSEGSATAVLRADQPAGLVHALLRIAQAGERAGLCWRVQDADNYFALELGADGASLYARIEGERHELASNAELRLSAGEEHALQISDDGALLLAHLDGVAVLSAPLRDTRLADARGVGVIAAGSGALVGAFEAHPRSVPVPKALRLDAPPAPRGETVELLDDFRQPPGDLDAQPAGGGVVWERAIGRGVIEATGAGYARVRASVAAPNPGRTAYLLPWPHPQLADLELRITPPGRAHGEGERGRGGVIFWQDPAHYVIVSNWLDDSYPGAAVSIFPRLGSFEELFRAVWSNLRRRIDWGVAHTLRVSCDGRTLLVKIDGETVLYRALSDIDPDARPLEIRRVGIVANWEWGDDTGSELRGFVARGP